MTEEETDRRVAHCRRVVERIAEATGLAWTFGYIGNLDSRFGDDRYWYAFAPHPGRVGKEHDRIGGYKTENLDQLALLLEGAKQLAVVLTIPR